MTPQPKDDTLYMLTPLGNARELLGVDSPLDPNAYYLMRLLDFPGQYSLISLKPSYAGTMKPTFCAELTSAVPLDRLTDPTHPNYLPPAITFAMSDPRYTTAALTTTPRGHLLMQHTWGEDGKKRYRFTLCLQDGDTERVFTRTTKRHYRVYEQFLAKLNIANS